MNILTIAPNGNQLVVIEGPGMKTVAVISNREELAANWGRIDSFSSTIDFPAEWTDNKDIIALCEAARGDEPVDHDDGSEKEVTAEQIIAYLNRRLSALRQGNFYTDPIRPVAIRELELVLDRITAHKTIGRSISEQGD